VNKNRRNGLGRGLGALIPTGPSLGEGYPGGPTETGSAVAVADRYAETSEDYATTAAAPRPAPEPVPSVQFAQLSVRRIRANPRQPRQVFDEEALAELTHSVREFGVLQPIVVRRVGEEYQLVMGERRLRAAQAAGLTTIPAIVRDTEDDAMLRDALLENIHRSSLNPLEEAAAYHQLLDEFGATHDELAQRIGRSRPQVTNTIRLLNLPIPVQRRVAAGVLSAGHARALLAVEDRDLQEELAARIVAEGLSVRATEELVAVETSGHGQRRPVRRQPAARVTAPAVTELADRLSDAFDTRVRVELGRRKGKITVEFASVDDLERIVALMAPRLSPRRDEAALVPPNGLAGTAPGAGLQEAAVARTVHAETAAPDPHEDAAGNPEQDTAARSLHDGSTAPGLDDDLEPTASVLYLEQPASA
jgi:ParB family transcriptional regulator, chromosome partitioning protein